VEILIDVMKSLNPHYQSDKDTLNSAVNLHTEVSLKTYKIYQRQGMLFPFFTCRKKKARNNVYLRKKESLRRLNLVSSIHPEKEKSREGGEKRR
jgi:hypothetical protein